MPYTPREVLARLKRAGFILKQAKLTEEDFLRL